MKPSIAPALIAIAPLFIATAGDIKPLNVDGGITGYSLVWHDEFDGSAVNTNDWYYRTGERLLSFQKPENVSVSGGQMHLALKKEDAGKLHYTAGGLISKRVFKYGYFEACYRCPKSAGWHTSFWTMYYAPPKSASVDYAATIESQGAKTAHARAQEIDICEQDSANNRSYSAGVIDWSGQHGKKSENFGRVYYRDTVPDFAAGFHVWGCEFTPDETKFFLDGKLTHKTDGKKFPHGDHNVWLTSVGALWGNPKKPDHIDDAALPAAADFDWVRVYEKKP